MKGSSKQDYPSIAQSNLDRRSVLRGIGVLGIASLANLNLIQEAAAAGQKLNFTAWEFQPDTIKSLVKAWEAKSKDKITISFIPNIGYTAGIQARQRGGKPADVFYNFAYNSEKFVQQKWAADLRGLPGVDGVIADMFPSSRPRFVAENGAIVSVPYFSAVHMLQYNKKMLADKGVTLPNSLAQTYTACKKLKDNGVAGPYTAYWVKEFVEEYLHVYLLANNVTPFDSKGEPVFADDSKAIEVFEWWQNMYKDGMTPKNVLTADPGVHTTAMAQGNAAFYALHHYFLNDIVQAKGPESNNCAQAKIVGTGGKTLQMGEVMQMGGKVKGAKRLAAWDFMKEYGYKSANGKFTTFTKWASAASLCAPYPAFFADADVKAAFPKYMDLTLIEDTFKNNSDVVPARTLPWYQGFQAQCGTIIHDLLLGEATPKATRNALAVACRTAKSGAAL